MLISEFYLILPELVLIFIALIGQMIGVFSSKPKIASNFFIITTTLLAIVIFNIPLDSTESFNGSFIVSSEIYRFKSIILGLTILVILLYIDCCDIAKTPIKLEFITLILLSVAGIFISISVRNFLVLFCALELQALTCYALAAFNTHSLQSTEGALKYFILGALISAIGAFGISFIYGFSGSLYFNSIEYSLISSGNIGIVIGLILFLVNIFFKLSAAPLHFWTPDVYQGAPIPSVTYFASAAKIGSFIVLINLLQVILYDSHEISVNLIKVISILSMLIGSLGAIGQNSLKRLMAYGTILNVGYSLIAVSLNNTKAFEAALSNMLIYAVSILGFFGFLVALLGSKSESASFADINGAASSRKAIAAGILILMFSMIGIPPFAGFFGKYYIFYEAIQMGEFILVGVGIVTSVIACYYYLKIIKAIYFIDPIIEIERIPTRLGLLLISISTISFIILFPLFLVI